MEMRHALAGLTVLEISSSFAGGYAGRLLAEAGLPVLRLELEDDPLLARLPPLTAQGRSSAWLSAHGKKGVLRLAAQDPLVEQLIARAPVFLCDQPQWFARRTSGVPGQITCQVQPLLGMVKGVSDVPIADVLVQALTGALSMTGRIGGPPVPIGFPVGDLAPAIFATIAVLDALVNDRSDRITVGAIDATVSLLTYLGASFMVDGDDVGFIGSGHPYIVPYGAYPASDGHVIVGAFNQAFWKKLCVMLERPDLAENPRYRKFTDRRDNRDELNALLNDLFSKDTIANWLVRLEAADVPAAPVYSMRQAIDEPGVAAREMLIEVNGQTLLNSPIVNLTQRACGGATRPALANDWRGSLRMLGLAEDEIDRLLSAGRFTPVSFDQPAQMANSANVAATARAA